MVCLLPNGFVECFPARKVNNIYYDTIDFKHYYNHINGTPDREKLRIRWYGALFSYISNPKLELKIKRGRIGYKDVFSLPPFDFSKQSINVQLEKILQNSNLCKHQIEEYSGKYFPILLNSYRREYWKIFGKPIRLTIDSNLEYYYPNTTQIFRSSLKQTGVIIELKFPNNDLDELDTILKHFQISFIKNSKYIAGVEKLYFYN